MKRLRAIWRPSFVELTCAWCYDALATLTLEEIAGLGSGNLKCRNCNGLNGIPGDLRSRAEHVEAMIDPDNPPGRAGAWDTIVGNIVLKRGLEVALVGHHTVCYVGNPGAAWEQVQTILGERATIMQKCLCGNFLSPDPEAECFCTLEEIRSHRTSRKFGEAYLSDLILEAIVPSVEEFFGHSEPYHIVRERIRQIRWRQNFWRAGMDVRPRYNPAFDLLNNARKRWDFTSHILRSVQRVAMTIAEMEGHELVQPANMAEALSYRTPLLLNP